jgi:stage V sporulation protein S
LACCKLVCSLFHIADVEALPDVPASFLKSLSEYQNNLTDMSLVFDYIKYKAVQNVNTCRRHFMDTNDFGPRSHGSAPSMIKVSADSRTAAVAGAIAGVIREHKHAEVQAIGAGAVNQAIKALVLATGYLKQDGIDVACVPEFADVTIEDKVRTAIKLVIDPH